MDLDEDTFLDIASSAAELARVEGLDGHAAAADMRVRRTVGE